MPTFKSSDGVSLFYQDWGHGEPMLWVHSWGMGSQMWAPHMLHFNALGMRTIAMDRRGHGRSDQPGAGYDYDRLADDLAELIERLDLRDVVLVGHSMGTGECTRLLARHGSERIARVIYVAPVAPRMMDADGREITAAITCPNTWTCRCANVMPCWLPRALRPCMPSVCWTTPRCTRCAIPSTCYSKAWSLIPR